MESEKDLSSALNKLQKKIDNIKKTGNAFVTDWELVEMIEEVIQLIKLDEKS
tara:strand:+ start:246 stop:401 length:156 start_codon:yes stop_codon:yes gene_type:complete